jgi:ankyrin repeat protein
VTTLPSQCRRLILFSLVLAGVNTFPVAAQTVASQDQLWDAAKTGDTTALSAALGRGARIDSLDTRTNRNGRLALNWAAWFDHPEAIRFLVRRGANINLANLTGFTPLHHAAENGSLAATRALVALGADRKLVNADGLRAVDVARERGRLEVASLLDSLPQQE